MPRFSANPRRLDFARPSAAAASKLQAPRLDLGSVLSRTAKISSSRRLDPRKILERAVFLALALLPVRVWRALARGLKRERWFCAPFAMRVAAPSLRGNALLRAAVSLLAFAPRWQDPSPAPRSLRVFARQHFSRPCFGARDLWRSHLAQGSRKGIQMKGGSNGR